MTPADGAKCGARAHGLVGRAPGRLRDPALRPLGAVREELARRRAATRARKRGPKPQPRPDRRGEEPQAERREAPVSRKTVTRQQKGWRATRRFAPSFASRRLPARGEEGACAPAHPREWAKSHIRLCVSHFMNNMPTSPLLITIYSNISALYCNGPFPILMPTTHVGSFVVDPAAAQAFDFAKINKVRHRDGPARKPKDGVR